VRRKARATHPYGLPQEGFGSSEVCPRRFKRKARILSPTNGDAPAGLPFKDPTVPQLEQLPEPEEKIRWINREPATAPVVPPETHAGWRDWLRRRRLLVGVVLVALILAAIVAVRLTGGGAPAAGAGAPNATVPLVSVVTPGLKAVTATVTFTGTVNARYDVAMGVEGEGGRIADIHVEAGDRVRRGQVLATLDTSVLRPQVARLRASLAEARAQAELSEAEYKRALGVQASGALSAEEIERRRAASVTAAAQVEVAAAQLAEARARLYQTELRAPDDGIVLTRSAEVGQFPTPGGEPLFRLARGNEVEVRAQLAEQDLPRVAVGQPVIVRLTGVTEAFKGRVRLIGPVIDPVTRLGWMRVALEPHPQLRPGAFARGEVAVGDARRAVLPQTAVLSDASGAYVMIVGTDGKVARRNVTVVDTTAQGIVIGTGLEGGEHVVATAAAFLREGETVKVAEAPRS
jgi:HlyD family secretion protein